MKRHFIKCPGGLRPAYDEDERWLSRKKTGALLELDIKEPRNAKLHRKWWSLANYLAEHSERFPTAEHASKYLLIQLGYCTTIFVNSNLTAHNYSNIPIADSIRPRTSTANPVVTIGSRSASSSAMSVVESFLVMPTRAQKSRIDSGV